ncbi:MAG: S41 family peptidase [Lysinibacillus sp.]
MKKIILSLMLVFSVLFSPVAASLAAANTTSAEANPSLVNEIKKLVTDYYIGTLSGDLSKATTVSEIVELLDPYSMHFTKEEYEAFNNSIELTTIGIGVVIEEHEEGIQILKVIDKSGASKAGLVPGDIIIGVNGQSIVGKNISETSSLLVGDEHSSVQVTIQHVDGSVSTKTIVRTKFSLPNVEYEMLYGNVGYISMSSFSEDGATLVRKALIQLAQRGATSYILDLQNNGGGYVSTAEQLVGLFPNAPIAFVVKTTYDTETVHAVRQSKKFPKNTRILVNRYSASASEMVAASLKDQDSAILYGETTYGKGVMQGFFDLSDGSLLKLTIGNFTGPKLQQIQDKGVTPHVTTTSPPIFQAHFDALKEQYSAYKQLPSMKNVKTSKTFKVNFSKDIAPSIPNNAVKIVTLGGDEIAVTTKIDNNQSLIITPNKALKKGQSYMLIVDPTLKSTEGRPLSKGMYMRINVAK